MQDNLLSHMLLYVVQLSRVHLSNDSHVLRIFVEYLYQIKEP